MPGFSCVLLADSSTARTFFPAHRSSRFRFYFHFPTFSSSVSTVESFTTVVGQIYGNGVGRFARRRTLPAATRWRRNRDTIPPPSDRSHCSVTRMVPFLRIPVESANIEQRTPPNKYVARPLSHASRRAVLTRAKTRNYPTLVSRRPSRASDCEFKRTIPRNGRLTSCPRDAQLRRTHASNVRHGSRVRRKVTRELVNAATRVSDTRRDSCVVRDAYRPIA